jgi:hypothetical protein
LELDPNQVLELLQSLGRLVTHIDNLKTAEAALMTTASGIFVNVQRIYLASSKKSNLLAKILHSR